MLHCILKKKYDRKKKKKDRRKKLLFQYYILITLSNFPNLDILKTSKPSKVNNKVIQTTSMTSYWCLYC